MPPTRTRPRFRPITNIEVEGFKSIAKPTTIAIKPMTVLAGTNSSGKSSIMQPLLLLKQTLEATFDPGPLLLSGRNVKFANSDEFLTKQHISSEPQTLKIGLTSTPRSEITLTFRKAPQLGVELTAMDVKENGHRFTITPDTPSEDLASITSRDAGRQIRLFDDDRGTTKYAVERERSFFRIMIEVGTQSHRSILYSPGLTSSFRWEMAIASVIHLPGLRGMPERNYLQTGVGDTYPGLFQDYVASVLALWQRTKQRSKLSAVHRDMQALGLTSKVQAKHISETEVAVRVGRLPATTRGGSNDLVNIADVGVGVSQALPIIVALHAAVPGQLVYVEQPEIHLHPRAQVALGKILAQSASRGIYVVLESHSALLLTAIQTAIAEQTIEPNDVVFHWFTRDGTGITEVSSVMPDGSGAYGEWPEDFGDVAMSIESEYVSAAYAAKRVFDRGEG